jgi:hypothetical protein
MPARGGEITKRKNGLYMARYTVHTPDGPKRETICARGGVKVATPIAYGA